MPKLTRRGLGITDGFASGYKRDELIQKLGHIEYRGQELAGDICDHVCRYPGKRIRRSWTASARPAR